MIVKVQLSLASSDGKQQMLIYNKDRSINYQAEATPEVIKVMKKEDKQFFHARLDADKDAPGGKRVALICVTDWQKW